MGVVKAIGLGMLIGAAVVAANSMALLAPFGGRKSTVELG